MEDLSQKLPEASISVEPLAKVCNSYHFVLQILLRRIARLTRPYHFVLRISHPAPLFPNLHLNGYARPRAQRFRCKATGGGRRLTLCARRGFANLPRTLVSEFGIRGIQTRSPSDGSRMVSDSRARCETRSTGEPGQRSEAPLVCRFVLPRDTSLVEARMESTFDRCRRAICRRAGH